MNTTNSSKDIGCTGCEHITDNKYEFCYMFTNRPDNTPCAQHNKFKRYRKALGKLFLDTHTLGKS
jgi:hypothetical protein